MHLDIITPFLSPRTRKETKEAQDPPRVLQDYYHAMGTIDEMKAQIQFPKLEPPPTDFLHQMEEYCREAPRTFEPSSHTAGGAGTGNGSSGQPQGAKKVRAWPALTWVKQGLKGAGVCPKPPSIGACWKSAHMHDDAEIHIQPQGARRGCAHAFSRSPG